LQANFRVFQANLALLPVNFEKKQKSPDFWAVATAAKEAETE
jgi:hypothetical protein